MKFPVFFICLTFLLISNSRCIKPAMDHSYVINIENNANHSIGYYFAAGGKYGVFYPDSLPESNEYIIYDIREVVSPGFESHLDWKKFFNSLPKDTLSVFIFHTDTLLKYNWDEVRNGYKILSRYDLSLDDLKKINFTIKYP